MDVYIRKDLQNEVEQIWIDLFSDAYMNYVILGVHMRGTDKAAHRKRINGDVYLEYMVQFIKYFKDKGRIFIATDDERLLKYVRNNWDKYIDSSVYEFDNIVKCQRNIIRSNTNQAIFNMKNVNKYEIGKQVLFDILLLAKCQWFLHSASTVSESVIYNNINLHDNSIHLEYDENRQIPFWYKPPTNDNSKTVDKSMDSINYKNSKTWDILKPYKCFILHKYHEIKNSSFLLNQIKLAKTQTMNDDDRCYYFVLFWIDNPMYSDAQKKDIKTLNDVLNINTKNHLFIIDYQNTGETFPNFYNFMANNRQYDWLQSMLYSYLYIFHSLFNEYIHIILK